jgi:D-alanyl-lipoteichoic acid acyltransferase DltB (MBOAT superfamily)
MLAAGIWHGSTMMFLLWGAIHGIGLAIHKIFQPILRHIPDNFLTIFVFRLITFCFVALCWAIFRSPDLNTAQQLFSSIFTNMDISYAEPFFLARTTWCILLFTSILSLFVGEKLYKHVEAKFIYWPWIMKLLTFLFVVQMVVELHSSDIQPFLYFRF